jgi:hypothetical protein
MQKASTLAYLMRRPVLRLSWSNETLSDSEVAEIERDGIGDERKAQKPFQFARGAMDAILRNEGGSDSRRTGDLGSDTRDPVPGLFSGFRLRRARMLMRQRI